MMRHVWFSVLLACNSPASSPKPPPSPPSPLHNPPPSLEAIVNAAPDHLKPDYAVLDRSYITAYANSQRNSRVHTEYQALTALEPVAPLNVSNDKGDGSRFLVIRPGRGQVEHVALETVSTFHVFTATGADVMGPMSLPGWQALYALEAVLGVTTTYFPWDEKLHKAPRFNTDAALHRTVNGGLRFADGMIFAAIVALSAYEFEVHASKFVHVLANALATEPNRYESGEVWDEELDGGGVAAISATSQITIATIGGRLVVYSPRGGQPRLDEEAGRLGAPLHGRAVLDVPHRADCPYAISIVNGSYYLLGSCLPGDGPGRPGSNGHMPALSLHIYMDPANHDSNWLSWLYQLNEHGVQTAMVGMPFAVRQPPIDVTGGRVVLAGNGIAAVERGAVSWHHSSTNRMRATAYRDGTLAVADGATLRILSRDGKELQALPTSEGEELKTPPAIAHDGSVWVAGNKNLYVATP